MTEHSHSSCGIGLTVSGRYGYYFGRHVCVAGHMAEGRETQDFFPEAFVSLF